MRWNYVYETKTGDIKQGTKSGTKDQVIAELKKQFGFKKIISLTPK
jgi:rubredoxin